MHLGAGFLAAGILAQPYFFTIVFDTLKSTYFENKTVKVLILVIVFQWIVIFAFQAIFAIIEFPVNQVSPNMATAINFIRSLIPIGIFETLFIYLLLIMEIANKKQKEITKELRKAVMEKDRIYSIVVHELQSPLNSTLHLLEIIKKHLDSSKKLV